MGTNERFTLFAHARDRRGTCAAQVKSRKNVPGITNMIWTTVACAGAITPSRWADQTNRICIDYQLREATERERMWAERLRLKRIKLFPRSFQWRMPTAAAVDDFLKAIISKGGTAFIHCAGGIVHQCVCKRALIDKWPVG
jgi:hypothetical protein